MTYEASKLNEYSDQLSKLPASGQFLINNPELAGLAAIPGPAACLADLIKALALTNGAITSESAVARAALKAVAKPVNDTGNALKTLLVPSGSNLSLADTFSANFLTALVSSFSDPISAMLETQNVLLQTGLSQIETVFAGDKKQEGWITEYVDRVKLAARSIFLTDDGDGIQLGGLILFAITEVLPAIAAEKQLLRVMRKQLRLVAADASSMPPVMIPQLPNLAVTNKLAEAERALQQVETRLRREDIWDAGAFQKATDAVCAGQDFIFRGGVDGAFVENNIKAFTGYTDAQINAFKTGTFLPNALFRLRLLECERLLSAFDSQDERIANFHENLIEATTVLDQLTDTKLGDIMSMLVQVLRQQVSGLRLDLQAQAKGFNGFIDGKTEANLNVLADKNSATTVSVTDGVLQARVAKTKEEAVLAAQQAAVERDRLRREHATKAGGAFETKQEDVYGFMASQAATFVALKSLCFVMNRTQNLNGAFSRLLQKETAILKQIRAIISQASLAQCGPSTSGTEVSKAFKSYVDSIAQRANNQVTTNAYHEEKYKRLIKTIDAQEQYLSCLESNLTFGFKGLAQAIEAAMAVANLLQTVDGLISQIRMLSRQYEDIRKQFETFDLKALLGIGAELSALDSLFKALTCLLLNCDNPQIKYTVELAKREFQATYDKRRAGTATMRSLDEELKTGTMNQIGNRLAALLKVVSALQNLTSLDIKQLCALADSTGGIIVTTPSPTGPPTVEQASPEQIQAAAAAAREEYAKRVAAAARSKAVIQDTTGVTAQAEPFQG